MTKVSNNLLKDATTTGKALINAATPAAARTTLELATVAKTGSYNDLTDKPTGGGGGSGSFAGTYHSVEFDGNGSAYSFYGLFPNGIGDVIPPTNPAAYVVSVGGVHQPPSAYTISYQTNNETEQGIITFGQAIPDGCKVSVQVTY
jgi:hypothetical protein